MVSTLSYSLLTGFGLLGAFVAASWACHRKLAELKATLAKREKDRALDEKILEIWREEAALAKKREELAETRTIVESAMEEIERAAAKRQAAAKEALAHATKEEEVLIAEGRRQLLSYTRELKPAEPRTEEERQSDLQELRKAIADLEALDFEFYDRGVEGVEGVESAGAVVERVVPAPEVDLLARSMFLDELAGKLERAIKALELSKLQACDLNKLLAHLWRLGTTDFDEKDATEALQLLVDRGVVAGVHRLNPEVVLLSFGKPIELNASEQVVVVFAATNDYLTGERLKSLTEWDEEYVRKVLDGLVKKGLATFEGDKVEVVGLESADEKAARLKLQEEVKAAAATRAKSVAEGMARAKHDLELQKKRLEEEEAKKTEERRKEATSAALKFLDALPKRLEKGQFEECEEERLVHASSLAELSSGEDDEDLARVLERLEDAATDVKRARALKENWDVVESGKQKLDQGDLAGAVEAFERSLEICEEHGLEHGIAYALEQMKKIREKLEGASASDGQEGPEDQEDAGRDAVNRE